MKPSIRSKLEKLLDRQEEVAALLNTPEVIQAQTQFRDLSREYAELAPVTAIFRDYLQNERDLAASLEMQKDPELKALGEEEYHSARARQETLTQELELLMLPKDPNDNANVFLEIRAAAGGDESAIFAGDLFRMYSKYAESQ